MTEPRYVSVLNCVGDVQLRDDCECGLCRAARGLEPLTKGELTARRESKPKRKAVA
jgi:hypothetical protein